MKTNIKILLSIFLLSGIIMTSCVKDEIDAPVTPDPCARVSGLTPTAGLTVAKLKTLYPNFEIIDAAGEVRKFPDSLNYVFEGTVISSDEEGNFYKEIYVQDATGGLKISTDATNTFNDYKVGQTVHIALSGLTVHYKKGSNQSSMIEIGLGSYSDKYGKKIGRIPASVLANYVKKNGAPQKVTPLSIDLLSQSDDNIGRLVQIEDIELIPSETDSTYALYQTNTNRHLMDCLGNTIILRNSGYANFASLPLPQKKGTITAILTKYGSDYQLMIRDTSDLNFTAKRCGVFFEKIFETSFGEFTEKSIIGNEKWTMSSYNGNEYAKMTGYDGSNKQENEDWLISPAIDLTKKTGVKFNIRQAANYVNGKWEYLQIMATDAYTGDPTTTSWTEITVNTKPSGDNWTFVDSEDVDFSAFDGKPKVVIAFKYRSTTNDAATWEIAKISLKE